MNALRRTLRCGSARRRLLAVCAAWIAVGTVAAEAQVVAIVGGEVHTAAGSIIAGGTVVLTDGRITAVGPDVEVPSSARVVDATGMVVTPGLMDPTTGIGLTEISAAAGTNDGTASDDRITAAFRVSDAVNPMSTLIPIAYSEGITSVGVAPAQGASIIGGQALVMDLGAGPAADMIRREPAALMVAFGERGSGLAGGSRANAALLLREVVSDVRDYQANHAAYESGARRSYELGHMDLEALSAVLSDDVPMVVQVNRASDIQTVLGLSRELGVRVVLAGAAEGWMVAADIVSADVPVIINPLRNLPTFDGLGATLENAARLEAAGVDVSFSTFDAYNVRNIKQLAGNAVSYGMSPEGALRAVTVGPAQILGVDGTQGTLEVGKVGDVVVWSGDPFEFSTQVRHVFIRGQEMSTETRQRALFRRYRDIANVPPIGNDPE